MPGPQAFLDGIQRLAVEQLRLVVLFLETTRTADTVSPDLANAYVFSASQLAFCPRGHLTPHLLRQQPRKIAECNGVLRMLYAQRGLRDVQSTAIQRFRLLEVTLKSIPTGDADSQARRGIHKVEDNHIPRKRAPVLPPDASAAPRGN